MLGATGWVGGISPARWDNQGFCICYRFQTPGRLRSRSAVLQKAGFGGVITIVAGFAWTGDPRSLPRRVRRPRGDPGPIVANMPPRRPASVVLHPPVEVMRPRAVAALPEQTTLPGNGGDLRYQFSVKLDGFRCVAHVQTAGRVILQSRSGRGLESEFRETAHALATAGLGAGTVLDGELVAHRAGRMSFNDLLRSPAARARDQVSVSYVAFDLLATPGQDRRALPLRQRWELLTGVLAGVGPPVEQVLATTDRDLALRWYQELRETGVEGIVARDLSSVYRAQGAGRVWSKIRFSDTVDARLVAVIGPHRRPHAVMVELPDGGRLVTSPRLDSVQSEQVAHAVAGRLHAAGDDGVHGQFHFVHPALTVEVRVGGGRHRVVRFVRVRGEI